jgi:hypothetical protein
MIVHAGAAAVLAAISGGSMWYGLQQKVGSDFVVMLVLSVLLVVPLVVLIYCMYALSQADYTLDRDGLRIRWGLRSEDIPLPQIEWVRPANQLGFHLPMPLIWLPGAILGQRTVEGLGPVEFIASDRNNLLLIATPHKIFAISPADLKAFMYAFQRVMEMGSPSPLSSHSAVPVAFLKRVWADRPARWLILIGLILCTALFVYVSLAIPGLSAVSLGFNRLGQPNETGPAERLLLLPVMAFLVYVFDLGLGLFFYRRDEVRQIAYVVWSGSLATPSLLLVAAWFLAG